MWLVLCCSQQLESTAVTQCGMRPSRHAWVGGTCAASWPAAAAAPACRRRESLYRGACPYALHRAQQNVLAGRSTRAWVHNQDRELQRAERAEARVSRCLGFCTAAALQAEPGM